METNKRKYLELILGIILLIPPLLSVLAFLLSYAKIDILKPALTTNALIWTGFVADAGGFTSALPFYFGLMAIAGAYLISNSTKK